MDTQRQWCDRHSCPDVGKVGTPNIKIYSHAERRYYCTSCHHTFNADTGTFFETLRTDHPILLDVVAMLVERNSLRAISRIKHCRPNTILHWLDLAGQHAAAVSEHLIHGLHVTQAQIDELWTFVKKSRRIFNPLIPTMLATLGFGKPSHYPVICASSIISVMTVASVKQPHS